MEEIGQLSPDANSYWDGHQWISTLSPDGNWRWDGRAWIRVHPPEQSVLTGTSASFFRQIPGFRSHTTWKMAVAVIGYLVIALLIAIGLAPASRGGIALGLGALIIVVIASNGWGLRNRVPLFRSPNNWMAALAWGGLVLLVLVAFVATQPTTPNTGGQQQQALNTASPSQTATPAPLPALASTPSPSHNPSPSPIASPRSTPRPSPTPRPPPPPPPTCGAPANPFGYDFCPPATLIYNPPSDFCTFFNCIPSFWNSTLGYVDECVDGTYSHSGGRRGACSSHRGELRPLYS
jgi:hypothetical protein